MVGVASVNRTTTHGSSRSAGSRSPSRSQAPVVQRIRIRYAKRGPLRFTSHRDFARAFERAVRRAGVPIAYSQGFTPHPKISYASAAPTGVASEAEYLEIGLQADRRPRAASGPPWTRRSRPAWTCSTPSLAPVGGSLADLIDASHWRIELPECRPGQVEAAVAAFLAAPEVHGGADDQAGQPAVRHPGGRGPACSVVGARRARSTWHLTQPPGQLCAILDVVVRQVTPTVRPDDVLAGLRVVADLEPPVPPRATRLAQGRLTSQGDIVDPLVADDQTSNDGATIGESSDVGSGECWQTSAPRPPWVRVSATHL